MLVRALSVMPSARTLPAALPIRRQATRGFTWGLLSVIALFLLPPNLLFQFGIDYDTSGGNPAMKIGPATYLAIIGAMTAVWSMRQSRTAQQFTESRIAIAFMTSTTICALYSFVSVGAASSSNYIETFLAPGFLTLALGTAEARQRRMLGYIMLPLVLLSVFMSLWESIHETHIIPMHIGTLDMKQIQGIALEDFRASGLYSHPLVASMVTSMSVFLLMTMRLPLWLSGIVLALLGVGLLSFGGRAALGVTVITLILAGTAFLLIKFVTRALTAKIIGTAMAAAILLPVLFGFVVTETGLGARIMSNLSFDDSSTEVRVVQWDVLNHIDLRDVLFGTSRERIDVLKSQIGLTGQGNDIENPWLLLFLNLGVIAFVPFVIGLFGFLIDIARRGGWPAGWLLIGSYLVIASTSNSFGVKAPDFCFLVAFAFAMSGFNAHLSRVGIAGGSPEPNRWRREYNVKPSANSLQGARGLTPFAVSRSILRRSRE